jgi:hypothetical protein
MTRKRNLPQGFRPHNGHKCPVAPHAFIVPVIRTAQGLGYGVPGRADSHYWAANKHRGGLGSVVGFRPAVTGEVVDLKARWPEYGKRGSGGGE